MTRRRVLLLGSVAVVAAMPVAVWLLSPRTAITPENAAKIQPGMTLAEVEAILGGPPRDETTGLITEDLTGNAAKRFSRPTDMYETCTEWSATRHSRSWLSNWLVVRVRFDGAAGVDKRECFSVRPMQESVASRLRRWLRL